MMLALIIIGYILGGAISYILTKRYVTSNGKHIWTVADRTKTISFSILSWAMVLVNIVVMVCESTENDKPAKW